jgi:hypothetical protein
MDNLVVKMFTETDKYPGHAVFTATKKMNTYLETVSADLVVSIQFQQSTYRDMDGDYQQDMFWYTLLVTTRTSVAEARQAADKALQEVPDYEIIMREQIDAEKDWEEEMERQRTIAQDHMAMIAAMDAEAELQRRMSEEQP